jgi:ribonucleoside-triphosphate reductase
MGCRSFLAPWKDEDGNYKFYGRFNRGVVTINLVDVGLSARKDESKFWEILDERLNLCKEALILRTKLIKGATSDVSPIHWQDGSVARLKSGEKIDKYLENGYSSISLGFIGLHEMCMAMFDESLTSEKGSAFALKVLQYLADTCNKWKTEEYLNGASLYATPSESLCYKFACKTAKRFGVIKGITDKDWFTNSYHVTPTEKIDAFSKLKFEAQYQNISKGGAVSYVEVPNMEDNLEALAQVIDFMYDNIQYAEINTRCGDVCSTCGYQGEITADKDGVWTCPNCGETNRDKLTVVRRTCGYIGSTFWNKGKTEEINERVYHL